MPDLNQADLLAIAVQAVGLGVDAEAGRLGDSRDELGQRYRGLNHGTGTLVPTGNLVHVMA